jgi:RimJ/RimL family protein N-acetyltransferase
VTAPTLHTARLTLAPWTEEHTPRLVELSRSPEVMRHIAGGQLWHAERAEAVSRILLQHWRDHGFGWRAMQATGSDRIVGFAGVAFTGENAAGIDPGEYELGCWVDPACWRLGFALEASKALLDEAFTRLGTQSVIVVIRDDHRASIAGAARLGFSFERRVEWQPGVQAVVHRLGASQWRDHRADRICP